MYTLIHVCVCVPGRQLLLKAVNRVSQTYADPGVFQGFGGSDAFARVDGQHLVDQILGLGSHCVPLWRRKLGRGDEELGTEGG